MKKVGKVELNIIRTKFHAPLFCCLMKMACLMFGLFLALPFLPFLGNHVECQRAVNYLFENYLFEKYFSVYLFEKIRPS